LSSLSSSSRMESDVDDATDQLFTAKCSPGDLHRPCAGAHAGPGDSSESTKREPKSENANLQEKLRLEATREGAQGTCLEILSCMVGRLEPPSSTAQSGRLEPPQLERQDAALARGL
jgi:hypothetical protein